MEKKICSYETLFAVSGNLAEDDCKALVEKFVNLVKENATDVDVNEWGKRRLAYPIDYITEGYYVLVNFKSEATLPLELNRVFGITDEILRYIVVRSECGAPAAEAEVAPAAEVTADTAAADSSTSKETEHHGKL